MANRRLNAIITIGGAVASTLIGSLTTTRTRVNEVGGALRNLERQQRSLSNAMETFRRQGRSVEGLRERYRRVTEEIERQRRELERVQRIERNREQRGVIGGKIGQTVAVGAAIALPAGAAVGKSSDFNYQNQVIGNTADMTKDQVAAMGQEILRVSDEVGKSAQTTQGALGYLVAAGMEIGTARGVLRSVGRTATATASDIEDVAKASFTLNDALKIQPGKMQGALDMLVQSGKEGNFEFKDMAAELPVLGAGLQALKMTGTEAVATIGAALQIARKGSGSSMQAATNVENFLAKVLSPETLKKARKLNSDLYGVVSRAQKKGQNPFEAAIKEINRITKGGDQKLLGELFQDMQVQNFLRPMLQNLKEYERIKKAALTADGVTARDFIKISETTKAQLAGMADAAGRAAIAIGGSLEPAVASVTRVVTPMLRGITDFANAHPNVVGGAILIVGGLTTLRLAALGASFAFTVLKGGLLATVAPLRLVGTAMMFAARGTLALGAALLTTPIGWVIVGIAAVAAGAYLIYKNWEPIKAWFKDLWADITATFDKSITWITDKIEWVADKWRTTKEWLGFGEDAQQPPKPPAAPAPPPMASGRGAGVPQVNDHSQHTFQIYQQPGQSTDDLATAVARKLREQQGVRNRSMMYDTVNP